MKGRCSEADLWLNLFFFFLGGVCLCEVAGPKPEAGGIEEKSQY